MTKCVRAIAAAIVAAALGLNGAAAFQADQWAEAMQAFEKQDRESPPPANGVVFVGSSSIRLWNLQKSFPDLPVINRGFGGSLVIDSANHVDLLVVKHKPRVVVFYAGDNDIAAGKTPRQVADDFKAFVTKLRAARPGTRVAFIGIKPSIQRWQLVQKVREANALIREYCDDDDLLGFVDVDGPMLGWDAKPRTDLFIEDGLHLSPKGYELWTALVRPFVEQGPQAARTPETPSKGAAAIVGSEFVFETAPFASAHASTIVQTPAGFVAAWFGGTREGAADVGIWMSRQEQGKWTGPIEVATGVQPDGTRHPCWNPVLFDIPGKGLALFYKVGPSPRAWWGMVRRSTDNGRTWSDAQRLPDGILGPVKNKPVRLPDGTIVSSSSTESEDQPSRWLVHFERSADAGASWTVSMPPPSADGSRIDAIQPSILVLPGGRLRALGRTRSGRVFETTSADGGRAWTPIALTALPNPSAGTDAVTLRDGRHLIVYNHTPKGRTPLNVSISRDGSGWEAALVLESDPGEYSYPAVIQASDGLVHITYTWKRQRIKHVVVDPARLTSAPMPDGKWPD